MDYAEASYFDGYAFQHIAAWRDQQRIERKRIEVLRALDRRGARR